ncbi:UxuA D-mannonate dehydratase [Rhabdaerophilaceae bacterium]
MLQSWRWFGPDDAVSLEAARQAGAKGIVTSLHHVPYGEIWSPDEIAKRQQDVAGRNLGLHWAVVESLPVHESIRIGEGALEGLFANYRQSLAHLAAAGIRTICYNFMPVLDWTRTQMDAPLPGGARALRFNINEYLAFDWLMLKRPGAEEGYSDDVRNRALAWHSAASENDKARLLANIMAGLPGAYARYDIPGLRNMLARYDGIGPNELRGNLKRFLEAVVPTAQDLGLRLCIHPDDPPRPVFGLPRVVSTGKDLTTILEMIDLPANGLTLCSGSLGANAGNDVPSIARQCAGRIWFAHLRNVSKDPDGSFMEAEHLAGDTDMVALIEALLDEEARREAAGEDFTEIPMRPDHGHEILDDIGRASHPGYPFIGRLRGLAELRGVMTAIAHSKARQRQA